MTFMMISLVCLIPCIIMAALLYGVFAGREMSLIELVADSNQGFSIGRLAGAIIAVGFIWTFLFTTVVMMFSALTKNRWLATAGIFYGDNNECSFSGRRPSTSGSHPV